MKKNNFENLEFNPKRDIVDVTIILNIWKRKYLKEQLFSILSQTVIPKEIWVIHYENHIDSISVINEFKQVYPNIVLIKSDKNLKYFGRFSLAINVTTKFTWLIDDDIIPGEKWLQACVEKCELHNSIVSCTGRLIPTNNFKPEDTELNDPYKHFIGDMDSPFKNRCQEDTFVDYACNSYFFKAAWIKAYWSIWPATFLSGEDIHLSATCKILLDVNTLILKQMDDATSGNIRKIYGADKIATWRTDSFIDLREKVLKYHILEHNWKPLLYNLENHP